MSFSNKKTLLITLAAFLIVVIGGGLGFLFRWQKSHPAVDLSPEAVKVKCLENVSKMNDQELMAELKKIKYPNRIVEGTNEERATYGIKQMINYLICRIRTDKDEELYKKAKKFIEGISTREENKKKELARLDRAYSGDKSFILSIAFGDLDELCPHELVNLCLKKARSGNMGEKSLENCKVFCDKLMQYYKDKDSLEKEIINYTGWSNDLDIFKKQYEMRLAIAYRFGGKDLALKICNNILESQKENCIAKVNYFNKIKEKGYCSNYIDNIKNIICAK